MKLLMLLLFITPPLFAGTMTFQDPCGEGVFLISHFESKTSVGELTIKALNSSDVDYQGAAGGMNSIAGTPVGLDAIEVLSDSHMRAYGWCYEVNGVHPSTMPDQVFLTGTELVHWFYAYSTNLNGEWVNYCVPSTQNPLSSYCK